MPPPIDGSQEELATLKAGVARLNHADLSRLLQATRFIDVANVDILSPSDKKIVAQGLVPMDEFRRALHLNDEGIIRRFRYRVLAENLNDGSITFNSERLRGANLDIGVTLAHEFGHKAIQSGYVTMTGLNEESAADCFAALVTSPQRVVDMLKSGATHLPYTNKIEDSEIPDPHATSYERAMFIAKQFPGKANLDGFPPPSSPSVTVNAIAEPVPVAPSPLPGYIRPSAPAPGMR